MNKYLYIGGFLGLAILIFLGIYFGQGENKNTSDQKEPEVAGQSTTATAEYFSEDAKVMYFYSDTCSWCKKQKTVLEELGKEGYKVKPMDVGENQDYWQKYDISGTPTFIADNGERLTGYQEYDQLKAWLDKNK